MKIDTTDKGEILLTEVYSGVLLRTDDGETMGICMRDSGFEFNYNGYRYSAQKGVVTKEKIAVIENTQKYSGSKQAKKMFSKKDVQSLIKVRNYFGDNDKTSFEHFAYSFLDKVINKIKTTTIKLEESK